MSPARIAEKMSPSRASRPIGGSGVHGGSRSGVDLQPGDLEQRRVVEERGHLVHVLGRECESTLELGHHPRIGVWLDLETHDGLESALQNLTLDERALALALVVFDLDLRVTADSEQVGALDLHSREERSRVGRDHLVEPDEDPCGRLHPARRRSHCGSSLGTLTRTRTDSPVTGSSRRNAHEVERFETNGNG